MMDNKEKVKIDVDKDLAEGEALSDEKAAEVQGGIAGINVNLTGMNVNPTLFKTVPVLGIGGKVGGIGDPRLAECGPATSTGSCGHCSL